MVFSWQLKVTAILRQARNSFMSTLADNGDSA
jgi:hypothetical protein